MDMKSLLSNLDIERPEEFEYFEQYAELAETDDDVPEDVLIDFFLDVDAGALRELTEAYFEEILVGVPDDDTDVYLLLTQIGKAFSGLADSIGGGDERRAYAEEFYRFKNWYTGTDSVIYLPADGSGERRITVLEALALSRADAITGHAAHQKSPFDFSDALDYEIDEYIVPVGSLASALEDDDEIGENLIDY
jgi:hypothetical protein